MARLRKFAAYRRMDGRAFTRKSKFKSKAFIKSNPRNRIIRFNMGDQKKEYTYTVSLVSKANIQIRDNALESARQSCNRVLETTIGKNGYYMQICVYPHHVLRENPLASGAGADRLSTGMKMSFGKSIGIAARIKRDQIIFMIKVNKEHLLTARTSLIRAKNKMPGKFAVQVVENPIKVAVSAQ